MSDPSTPKGSRPSAAVMRKVKGENPLGLAILPHFQPSVGEAQTLGFETQSLWDWRSSARRPGHAVPSDQQDAKTPNLSK